MQKIPSPYYRGGGPRLEESVFIAVGDFGTAIDELYDVLHTINDEIGKLLSEYHRYSWVRRDMSPWQ